MGKVTVYKFDLEKEESIEKELNADIKELFDNLNETLICTQLYSIYLNSRGKIRSIHLRNNYQSRFVCDTYYDEEKKEFKTQTCAYGSLFEEDFSRFCQEVINMNEDLKTLNSFDFDYIEENL